MIFVNPLVLIGLIAAALPLLVHLFHFRRPRKLDYSSIALLQSIQRTTMQRVRIRNWLLLVLRTLALCALIFVFARPTLTGISSAQFPGHAGVSMVLVLDASLSMIQRDADGTRLAQAKSISASIVQSADPGDEIFVLGQNANYLQSVHILADLQPVYVTRTAAQTIQQASALLQKEAVHLNKVVYYLGDLQETTLTDSLYTPASAGTDIVLIPIGNPTLTPNVGIANVHVTSQIIDPGAPVTVEATVINYGTSPIDDYAVSLYLADKHVAQTSASLPPGAPVLVRLQGIPETRGWMAGTVMIEDDGFEVDNQRHFTLHVPKRRDILIVYGSIAETKHIELSLSVREEPGSLHTTKIPQNRLAATPLNPYSAIVLTGLDRLSSGEIVKLQQYVQGGGGVLLFPGTDPDPVNTLLDAFGAGQITIQDMETSLESADFEHPLFEGVFTASASSYRLESVQISRAAHYRPSTGAEQTLIAGLGRIPLLQEIRYERGRILFWAVAPQLSWSDLPVRGLFVPLMYRTAHYLSSGGSIQGEQALVGSEVTVRLPATQKQITLKLPDGTELIPAQRQVFDASVMEFIAESPGISQVLVEHDIAHLISTGLDPRESRLSYATPDEAGRMLSEALETTVDVMDVDSPQNIPAAVRKARTGLELWRHFLILGLALLAAEMLLAARWRHP